MLCAQGPVRSRTSATAADADRLWQAGFPEHPSDDRPPGRRVRQNPASPGTGRPPGSRNRQAAARHDVGKNPSKQTVKADGKSQTG